MLPKPWRLSVNMSIDELVKKIGRSEQTLNAIESGKLKPSFHVFNKYYEISNGVVDRKDWNELRRSWLMQELSELQQ